MAAMTISEIQEALLRMGVFPGEIDGIWGRRTRPYVMVPARTR